MAEFYKMMPTEGPHLPQGPTPRGFRIPTASCLGLRAKGAANSSAKGNALVRLPHTISCPDGAKLEGVLPIQGKAVLAWPSSQAVGLG